MMIELLVSYQPGLHGVYVASNVYRKVTFGGGPRVS